MIACPVCAFRNLSANTRCLKCNALLKDDEDAYVSAREAERQQTRKERWMPPVEGLLQAIWHKLPWRPLWCLPETEGPYRFPFTAGLLSLIPGGGQMYNRQVGKGVFLASAWWSLAAACLLTLRQPWSNFLLLCLMLAWLLIWNDAVATSVRINRETWSFRNSVALWFGATFLAGLTVAGTQFFGRDLVTLVCLFDVAHAPHLHTGDLVLVNRLSYTIGSPRPGDVIYFDPERFTIETPQRDTVSVNIKDYFQKVSGVGGDLIEMREGRLYRNGILMPGPLLPFGSEVLPGSFSLKVPAGRVWAPVTGVPTDVAASLPGASAVSLNEGMLEGWMEASLVSLENVKGRAVVILNPPPRRKWLK